MHLSQHQNTVTTLKHISHQERVQWRCSSLPYIAILTVTLTEIIIIIIIIIIKAIYITQDR